MRIEQIDLTFMNIPLVRPEVWSHGSRSSYTVGSVEVHTDAGIKIQRFHDAFEADGYASCFPDGPSDPVAFIPGL